jgi:hypothetical protein|nr:MAG TPA: hypothetical protein [Caudoviricetes sp.]DAN61654.1 MAG TPA: hypothetical protein [Caudoviricetes sp.]
MTELVKLKAPEGFTDISFGGQSYTVGEGRIVEVPSEAAQFLYQFGFGNVAAETEEPEEPEKAKRGRKAKTEQPAEQPAEQTEPVEAVEPAEAEQVEAEQAAEPEKAE